MRGTPPQNPEEELLPSPPEEGEKIRLKRQPASPLDMSDT